MINKFQVQLLTGSGEHFVVKKKKKNLNGLGHIKLDYVPYSANTIKVMT